MKKILYCKEGAAPEVVTIPEFVNSEIQKLIGPTTSVEVAQLPGGFIVYLDMGARERGATVRDVAGHQVHGSFFIAKQIKERPWCAGMTDNELAAWQDILVPKKRIQEQKKFNVN